MSVASYVIGIVCALAILIVAIEMLRRGKLRERHALLWIIAGILALVCSIFPGGLEWLATRFGVEIPVNLLFFGSIIVLFLVTIQQASELTRLEDRTRKLAEDVALLEEKLASGGGSTAAGDSAEDTWA